MIKNYFSFSLFIILLFSPVFLMGQEQPELLKWFDNQIGTENTRLLNGTAYSDRHRTINEKNKLFGSATGKGSVLYDGQWFPDLQMRYNVFDDVLVVQLESGLGLNIIQLVKEKVERFNLNGTPFINIIPQNNAGVTGFHEVLWEDNNFKVLKKHALRLNEKRDREISYFEFEPIEGHYAFTYGDRNYILGSRNDLETIFPQYRSEIQNHYRSDRSILRSRPETFYTNLFRELSGLEDELRKMPQR
ncbi:hypothetical protein FHG64_13355 [Antarcticibacterium flavum]|uniref:Uncharacterized protein n=1 Tax=Antarcticibacterium flavum TaxID=2058175 RepID=A0A5B7X4Y3_9FLAO|nr:MULTISPECIES: hypothetical protein [Antarcticibacterium]MCM4158566.1 hypothetical protein [Antarcticibacterium sp. W02-3]QCY70310.1 hypothetical protein FHG64_13355 [Antarcticibacterium flavum]